jgi:hypothetical protein
MIDTILPVMSAIMVLATRRAVVWMFFWRRTVEIELDIRGVSIFV